MRRRGIAAPRLAARAETAGRLHAPDRACRSRGQAPGRRASPRPRCGAYGRRLAASRSCAPGRARNSSLRFVNELDRELALHWHGVRGPSEMMSISVAPGEANAFDCGFTPPDAGTFWLGAGRRCLAPARDGPLCHAGREEKERDFREFAEVPLDLRRLAARPMTARSTRDLRQSRRRDRARPPRQLVHGQWQLSPDASNFRAARSRACAFSTPPMSAPWSILFKGADPLDHRRGRPAGAAAPASAPGPGPGTRPAQRSSGRRGRGERDPRRSISSRMSSRRPISSAQGASSRPCLPDNFALPPNPISTDLDLAKAHAACPSSSKAARRAA